MMTRSAACDLTRKSVYQEVSSVKFHNTPLITDALIVFAKTRAIFINQNDVSLLIGTFKYKESSGSEMHVPACIF